MDECIRDFVQIGTGLSYTTKNNYCDTDLKINTDFYYFLNQFFLLHRQTFLVETEHGALMVNRRLYFTGESHAGHYIPSMMDFILQQNENILASTSNNMDVVIMPLSGAAIGNGWIHPYYQYSGAEATHLMGLIDQAQRRHLDEAEIKCQSRLDAKILDGSQCLSLIDDIVSNSNGQGGFTVNSYDVSLNKIGRYPPGLDLIENYFGLKVWVNPPMDDINTETVLQALHASGFTKHGPYRVCADKPYYALAHQDGLGVTEELTRVLDHPSRPKILIYNGMRDIVCNHVGTERTLDNLHWHGNADWIVAQRYTFSPGSTRPVGFVKEFDNLIFLKIPAAGHMVPFDQPEVSLEMIRRLVYNIGFGTMVQELELRTPDNSSLTECPHCSSCDNESDSTTNLGGNASVIATKSYTYIGSLVVGFAVGVGLSCLIYCLLSYIHKIQGPRTKPYPVSPMEIEDGVGSMS
jgi:carboxypeptidase D